MEAGVVIVGSGLAGYMTAKAFRQLDAKTALTIISRDDGCFYSKPQLSTGLAHKKEADQLAVYTAEQMAEQLNAAVLTQTAVDSVDADERCINLSSGEKLVYRDLVLANGADVMHAPLAGDAVDRVISVNSLQDYRRFRRAIAGKHHVAILGAGLVGCEYANDLLKAGYQVSLIAPDHYPLQRFLPEVVGQCMQQGLTDIGAKWHLQQFVTEINQQGEQLVLTLCDQRGQLSADVVLSAIGFRPNENIARSAGVHCDRGIVTDRQFQTSVKHIYAIGDCAIVDGVYRPFVAPINFGAKVLASNLVGEQVEIDYPLMPIVTKTPACPLVMLPPPVEARGEWHIDGQGVDLSAAFIGEQGSVQGFVLTGQMIKQRLEWMKKIT